MIKFDYLNVKDLTDTKVKATKFHKLTCKELQGKDLYLLGAFTNNMNGVFQTREEWWLNLWNATDKSICTLITSHGQAMSDYWAYADINPEELEALNIKYPNDLAIFEATNWESQLIDRKKVTDNDKYKEKYAGCVLCIFEDHNYYDDSDSWTVYYDPKKKEFVEEFWTTRGYCPTVNANPRDIQYNLHNCPEELKEEIRELLRAKLYKTLDLEAMAKSQFSPRYKYQEESAMLCQEEFIAKAPQIISIFEDLWVLIYLSDLHTGDDFRYQMEKNAKDHLIPRILKACTRQMVAERKRARAVYGKQYTGIVRSKKYVEAGYYQAYSSYKIVVDVDGFDKPFYLSVSSCPGYVEVDKEINFTGILSEKEGDKYRFVNKVRIIEEGDILSWH